MFYFFDDSFTSTRCLYLSPSQLCLIKRICISYARARTHTCPCAYAHARTLVARGSRQKCMRMDTGSLSERTQYSRGGGIPAVESGGIPVVEVHEGAKRPGIRIIPDSPENTPHQSKSLPHSAAHTSQPRRRLRGRRPRATLTPSTRMQRAE